MQCSFNRLTKVLKKKKLGTVCTYSILNTIFYLSYIYSDMSMLRARKLESQKAWKAGKLGELKQKAKAGNPGKVQRKASSFSMIEKLIT